MPQTLLHARVLLLFLGFTAATCDADDPPRKIALLVGISDYFDKNMADLNYAENDVAAVSRELRPLGFETTVIQGKQATRQNVDTAVDAFVNEAAKLESNAIVFLMFSGHGQELKTTQRASDSRPSRIVDTPFFCPRDAVAYDPNLHTLRGKNAETIAKELNLVSLNRVISLLDQRSNSRRNLLVIDACRNNPAKGKSAGITGSTAINLPKGISILFAAKSGQKSWESADESIPHGVMTHFLLKGLRGDAKNRRAQITWSRLVSYIREEVEFDAGRIAGGPSRKQSPHAIINDDEVIVLNLSRAPSSYWNRFRGPNGSGINANARIPLKWKVVSNDAENLRWKTKLPGNGFSSPVVFGEKIVLTAYTESKPDTGEENPVITRHVLCYDLKSGNEQWRKDIISRNLEAKSSYHLYQAGFASASAAVDDGGVCVSLGRSGIQAFDWNGKHQWTCAVAKHEHGCQFGEATSPIIDGGSLFLLDSETEELYCLDRESGDLVWKTTIPGFGDSYSTPIIVQKDARRELIVSSNGRMSAYSPDTGEHYWNYDFDRTSGFSSSPVEQDGVIYLSATRTIVAIEPGGSEDLTDYIRWESKGGTRHLTPLVTHDAVWTFSGFSGANLLQRRSLETGEILASERFPGKRSGIKSQGFASLVMDHEHILCLSGDGTTHVFHVDSGFKEIANNKIDEGEEGRFMATPAVLNDCLLIRSDQYLYCIGE